MMIIRGKPGRNRATTETPEPHDLFANIERETRKMQSRDR